jgi:membrane protease YdiL (CAAX protease family)
LNGSFPPRTASPPLASPAHRALVFSAFGIFAAILLRPLLFGGEGKKAPEPDHPDFIARTELNQTIRVVIGLDALAQRVPALESELRKEIEKVVKPPAAADAKPLGRLVALGLYVHLDAEEETAELRMALKDGAPAGSADDGALELLERLYVYGRALSEDEAGQVGQVIDFAGKLAAVESARLRGDGAYEELRGELTGESERFLVRLVVGVVLVLTLLSVGSLLFVVALTSMIRGTPTYRWGDMRMPSWLQLETFTLFLGLMIGLAALRGMIPGLGRESGGLTVAIQLLLFLVIGWPIAYGVDRERVRDDLGLGGMGRLRECGWGVVGYAAGLPLLALGFVATSLILRFSEMELGQGIHPIAPVMEEARSSPGRVIAIFFFAVVLAPLIEELMFRGYLYNALRSRMGAPWAIGLSAALFAGIHPQGWIGLPPLLAVGVVLGILREWRGSIWGCVVAHAMNNGLVMLIMLLML